MTEEEIKSLKPTFEDIISDAQEALNIIDDSSQDPEYISSIIVQTRNNIYSYLENLDAAY